MNELENALVTVDEELNELINELLKASIAMQARIHKALRFTGDEVQPGQEFTNAERINEEFNDLLGAAVRLKEKGFPICIDSMRVEAKLEKLESFARHSRDVGALAD